MGTVYTVDGPDPADGGLPETPVRERADGTLLDEHGRAPSVRYAVSYQDIAGQLLARDAGIGLGLYRVDGRLVFITQIHGVDPDTWAGRLVTYRRLRCAGGKLTVRLGTDEHLFDRTQTVTAHENGRVVGRARIVPGEQPPLVVPLRPGPAGTCFVVFEAELTRVPARVQPGNTDRRRLAAHYYAFDYSPR